MEPEWTRVEFDDACLTLRVKDGKLEVQGYDDIENEYIAFLISGKMTKELAFLKTLDIMIAGGADLERSIYEFRRDYSFFDPHNPPIKTVQEILEEGLASSPLALALWADTDTRTTLSALAREKNTPGWILQYLTTRNVHRAYFNPSLPTSFIASVVKSKDEVVRNFIASNPSLSDKDIETLAHDPNWEVVARLIENFNISIPPKLIKEILANTIESLANKKLSDAERFARERLLESMQERPDISAAMAKRINSLSNEDGNLRPSLDSEMEAASL